MKDEKGGPYEKTRTITIAVLIVGGSLALQVARAQQAELKHTDRATEPARLLAVLIVDAAQQQLVIPDPQ